MAKSRGKARVFLHAFGPPAPLSVTRGSCVSTSIHQTLSPSRQSPTGKSQLWSFDDTSHTIGLLLLASNASDLWVLALFPIWHLKFFYEFLVLHSHCWKVLACFLFS